MPGPSGRGPTILRILLGAQFRRLREDRGISRETAGETIRASASKISRMELGQVHLKERDVADLLTLYGVTDPADHASIMALAKRANEPGWWHAYQDVLPEWFQTYIALEGAATRIRAYEVQYIPGLLQTEDYARAVITAGNPEEPRESVERRVRLRMARQEVLGRQPGPRLWAVLDEAALHRVVGGPAVMRAQLQKLLDATGQHGITLQVLPFALGGHAAEGGAFTILRFAQPELPDVGYAEQLTTAVYLEKREDVERYGKAMDRLSVDSASRAASIELIKRLLTQIPDAPAC